MEGGISLVLSQLALLILMSTGGNGAPHIVMVFVDDMGWNDVSWHNDYIIMDNLARLASEGVILDQAYAQELCSPSRAALLTGYYPVHIGMQEGTVSAKQLNGLPLDLKLLPEYLSEAGYTSHMIGKWHLGFCNETYTPTKRGFTSHYGFYNGGITYYTHESEDLSEIALDYRDDLRLNVEATGNYTTADFTDQAIKKIDTHNASQPMFLYMAYNAPHSPLEVSQSYIDMYPDLGTGKRATYLGMITALDDQVKRLEDALIAKGMWDDTVFVFHSDNGGVAPQTGQGGNNYPLRGGKDTLYEGGFRVPAFVRSSLLKKTGYVNNRLIHITDMFATFLHLAGVTIPDGIDGKNVWDSIRKNKKSPRKNLVYNIIQPSTSADPDSVTEDRAAIRFKNLKLIEGMPALMNNDLTSWVRPRENRTFDAIGNLTVEQYGPYNFKGKDYYLFDLEDDPYETNNIASTDTKSLKKMIKKLKKEKKKVLTAIDSSRSRTYSPLTFNPPAWNPGFCPES